jgi:hypothetical protein
MSWHQEERSTFLYLPAGVNEMIEELFRFCMEFAHGFEFCYLAINRENCSPLIFDLGRSPTDIVESPKVG